MSAGGVFKLMANAGKADNLIMATELLRNRLKQVMCLRKKSGLKDPTPTLVDIERTHLLFVNAHFKPFASIASEYNKVKTNAGNPSFESDIQFSIPQFGDFFSDMVVNATLSSVSATVGTVPALPTQAFTGFPQDVTSTATSFSSALQDTTAGVYKKVTLDYVDAAGNVLTPGAAAQNFVRYCEFPGQRLFSQVKFDVNNNPLDEYTAEAVNFHQKFCVPPHKMVGWKRLVGQEVPVEGYSDLLSISGASSYAAVATGIQYFDGSAVPAAPVNASVTARKLSQVVFGPQTPQLTQPELDLWVPLLFWFCLDSRIAVASVCVPYGQRFITMKVAPQSQLVFAAPGNVFQRVTVEVSTSAGTGKGTKDALAVTDVKTYVTRTPVLATGSVVGSQTVKNIELYINNLFVNPEIHDIYIKRIGFTLIRLHKEQQEQLTKTNNSILLNKLKHPVEYIYLGLKPMVNFHSSYNPNLVSTTAANVNQYRDWHRFTGMRDNVIDVSAKSASKVLIDDTVAWSSTAGKIKTGLMQQTAERIVFATPTPTIDTLALEAHGVSIFSTFKTAFFGSYAPYTFGESKINTPEDTGVVLINFAQYPGSYQPSGHVNVSRTREFYLAVTSSFIGDGANSCMLIVLARAINFLIIADGSAVLRYTT